MDARFYHCTYIRARRRLTLSVVDCEQHRRGADRIGSHQGMDPSECNRRGSGATGGYRVQRIYAYIWQRARWWVNKVDQERITWYEKNKPVRHTTFLSMSGPTSTSSLLLCTLTLSWAVGLVGKLLMILYNWELLPAFKQLVWSLGSLVSWRSVTSISLRSIPERCIIFLWAYCYTRTVMYGFSEWKFLRMRPISCMEWWLFFCSGVRPIGVPA